MDRSEVTNDNISSKGDPSLKYILGDVLGEGSYGTVYRGTSISSKVEFAIKILPFEADGGNLSNIAKEIAILKNLRSPFVVSFHESYVYDNEMWIIMECCRGGSLIDLIEVTNFQVRQFQLQIDCDHHFY
jgi:serine/threonine-protein kinase 24/25/MST4